MSPLTATYRAAVEADSKWSRALERAGLQRYSPESSQGRFAPLYIAKTMTHNAWREASRQMLGNEKD